ncbi:MAG TPA: universal stress protein [Blastocatellia bacterium]|nr:universal stress protein [Blastocatellia bacterium]
MKILLAVDGSAFSDAAVEEVARRPWPEGSEVKVLHVAERPLIPATEPWALPDNYFEEMDRAAREHARMTVEKAVAKLAQSKLESSIEVVEGYPKHVITDEAERWGADLIVLGSHGYRGLTKLLLGSVSQAVASHAHCSVEIVRKHESQ